MLHFHRVSCAIFSRILIIMLTLKMPAERQDTLHLPSLASVVVLTKTSQPRVNVMFLFNTKYEDVGRRLSGCLRSLLAASSNARDDWLTWWDAWQRTWRSRKRNAIHSRHSGLKQATSNEPTIDHTFWRGRWKMRAQAGPITSWKGRMKRG